MNLGIPFPFPLWNVPGRSPGVGPIDPILVLFVTYIWLRDAGVVGERAGPYLPLLGSWLVNVSGCMYCGVLPPARGMLPNGGREEAGRGGHVAPP